MRTFLAFPISDANREAFRVLQDELQQRGVKGRWCRPDNLHLTVLFLGEQNEESLSAFSSEVERICCSCKSFTLRNAFLETLERPPRVLCFSWRDSAAADQYSQMAEDLLDAADKLTVQLPENVRTRKPLAHLTLARFRDARESRSLNHVGSRSRGRWEWDSDIKTLENKDINEVHCSRLRLYQSLTRANGPEYKVLQEFALS